MLEDHMEGLHFTGWVLPAFSNLMNILIKQIRLIYRTCLSFACWRPGCVKTFKSKERLNFWLMLKTFMTNFSTWSAQSVDSGLNLRGLQPSICRKNLKSWIYTLGSELLPTFSSHGVASNGLSGKLRLYYGTINLLGKFYVLKRDVNQGRGHWRKYGQEIQKVHY